MRQLLLTHLTIIYTMDADNPLQKNIKMDTAQGHKQFKFDKFDVIIIPVDEKKLQITVIDPYQRIEFHDKLLTLTTIGTSTLLKAFEKNTLQIKLGMEVKKTSSNAILEINVLVASQFFQPLEEVIYVKKSRDLTESEILKNTVTYMSSRVKAARENENKGVNIVRYAGFEQQKLYNSANNNFQQIASIKLPKGSYILTLSFQVRAQNSLMYLYFQKNQPALPNGRYYLPSRTQFTPVIFRKFFAVTGAEGEALFTSYYNQSYPVTLRNVVLTAHAVDCS